MRKPIVLPMSESPFDMSLPATERQRRLAGITGDVVTDEAGVMVAFQLVDDVEALLADRRFGAVAMPILGFSGVTDGALYDLWSHLMFGKDGEAHRRIRGAVAAEFTPSAVERYRERIGLCATALAEGLSGEVELWADFALPLAARSACFVVGIPEEDADEVGQWALDLVLAFFLMDHQQRARAERAAVEFTAYLDAHLEAVRAAPGDDVSSRLVAAEGSGAAAHDLTYDERRALVANLVFGGLEATAKAITTGVYNLITEGQWERLRTHPSMVEHAAIELLRFSPPVGGLPRLVTEDGLVRDVPLSAGQLVTLSVTSPCRDPQRFADPDSLILDRSPGRQLVFGAGPHFCLGANLAKVVLESALTAIATRFAELEILSEPRWNYDVFSGIVELHLVARQEHPSH
jgi:cytochrome P450